MGIRESLLNTITSVGNGDFIRIVTSAGASSKATLANVFKSFESGLGAKSNLGTSDYVRVVGSDNNAYKQSVSDVVDLLNNNMPIPQFSASGFADLETKLSSFSGRYIASVTGSDGATPGLNTWTVIGFKNFTGSDYAYGFQYAFSFDDAPYVRYRRNSTTWGAWQKMPNRTEVDALNSKTFTTLTKSTSVGTFEYYTYKYGSLFMGYIIFKPSNDIADDGEIVSAGVPSLITAMQLPVTCIAGTQAGQTGRCRIGNGKIVNWYSAMSLKAGNTYLIPVNALCA